MAKITFITQDNISVVVEGQSGSVMALAVENGIKGIDGDSAEYALAPLVMCMFKQIKCS